VRLDKWLWAARFFKTRSLAQQAIGAGRVKLNEGRVKPSHELKVGDAIVVRVADFEWQVKVRALSDKRGPAEQARKLYEETEASRAERQRRVDLRRWGAEPASNIKGRPTKRDRRRLEDLTTLPDESWPRR
jgi:ribosome-associated heat shock protein Hsp15